MERDELRAELADNDLDVGDGRRAAPDETLAEAYDTDRVVPPVKSWEDTVAALGFEYSAKASIVLDKQARDSGALIRSKPDDRRRVVRAIASMAAPSAGHWNNRGIAEVYLKWLDSAEKSFKKAIACAEPQGDVTRARSNHGRLDKLAAE